MKPLAVCALHGLIREQCDNSLHSGESCGPLTGTLTGCRQYLHLITYSGLYYPPFRHRVHQLRYSNNSKTGWHVIHCAIYTSEINHSSHEKSYVLNQNWNQSDPDLYPETQPNFLATGLILNSKLDLYQFCRLSNTDHRIWENTYHIFVYI